MQVCSVVISFIMQVKIRLCLMVKWNRFDFLFIRFIVVQVMVIDCGEIILLVMLLVVLVVISRILEMLICCVVVVCSVVNRVLDEVFELVRNIFSQLRNGEKKVNVWLVWVSVRVRVDDSLEQLEIKVNVSIMLIEQIGSVRFFSVLVKVVSVFFGFMCSQMMDSRVVNRMVVLVVDSQLNLYIVVQGVVVLIIGGIWVIILLRNGIEILIMKLYIVLSGVNSVLNGGMFYRVMVVVRNRNGDQVWIICFVVQCVWVSVIFICEVLRLLKWKMCIGCQCLRNRVRQIREISDEMIFGSFGLRKLELRYWVIVNELFVIIIVGQVFLMLCQLFIIVMIQNSMIMVRNGSWWFIIWLMVKLLILVIWLVIRIGMFIVLKVIGVVLMIRYRLVVYSGLNLRLISSVVVIVIGVLKFVVFLRKVLNEKLMISICRCWFGVIDRIDEWMMLNCLVFIEILQMKIVVIIIYVIGYRLQKKLQIIEVKVWFIGILQNSKVMISVIVMVQVVVMQFFSLSLISVKKKNRIGSDVIRLDSQILLVGLQFCCQRFMQGFYWVVRRGGLSLCLLLILLKVKLVWLIKGIRVDDNEWLIRCYF